jgi:hypothetical protein
MMGQAQRLAPGHAIDNSPRSLEDDFEPEVLTHNPCLSPSCRVADATVAYARKMCVYWYSV